MAFHVSRGCEACADLVALRERMDREASAQPTVPEDLVLAAKAVFPARLSTGPVPGNSQRGAGLDHPLRDRPAD